MLGIKHFTELFLIDIGDVDALFLKSQIKP